MINKDLFLYITIISILFPFFNAYTAYKLNTFFFFDPVTNSPCNENNYWTPFDQSTTCYRFVSITSDDTTQKEKN